jgi:hypothetical protein
MLADYELGSINMFSTKKWWVKIVTKFNSEDKSAVK